MKKKLLSKRSSIQLSEEIRKDLGKMKKISTDSYEDVIRELMKNKEVGKMVEKAIKKVFNERESRKKYAKKEKEIALKSRKGFISREVKSPFCRSCFRDDWFDGGKVGKWQDYCDMKLTRKTEDIQGNQRAMNYGHKIGETFDFECQRNKNHHVSISLNIVEVEKRGGNK